MYNRRNGTKNSIYLLAVSQPKIDILSYILGCDTAINWELKNKHMYQKKPIYLLDLESKFFIPSMSFDVHFFRN